MTDKRTYRVTVTKLREYAATITIRAASQAAADRAALAAFNEFACEVGFQAMPLGLPPPWQEHESSCNHSRLFDQISGRSNQSLRLGHML